MSPLTKAFVVLVTVLSVLLVALIVPFVARTQDANTRIRELEAQVQTANQTAALRQGEVTTVMDQLASLQSQFANERNAMNSQLVTAQSQRDQAQADLAKERAERVDLRTSLARLTAAAEQDAALLSTLRNELNTGREEVVTVRGQNIQLADRAVELESSLAASERAVRSLREQMMAMQQQLAVYDNVLAANPELRPHFEGGQQTGGTGTPTTTPVQGQVTTVQGDARNQFVQVDLGSNDGIQQGNRLMVARGRDFVATVVIEQVNPDASAGRVILSQQPVQQGDSVFGGQF